MPRPFRFACPAPGGNVLLRPRLLASTASRWHHRVVVIVAPAGFGKTTLLAQATEENALAPQGTDVWVTCQPSDSGAATLVEDLLWTLGERSRAVASLDAEVGRVAAAVWRRSPEHVAIVLDDVHEVARDSPGAELVAGLLAELPENGHLVLAGRTEPPVALHRLEAQGQVVRIGEEDLRLAPDELSALATRRGRDPEAAAGTGGWPALVELTLALDGSSAAQRAEGYVWEEVVAELDAGRRRAVAALVAVGGGDDEVASAAADHRIELGELLAGLPLVDRRPDGSARLHPLWAGMLAGQLSDDERRAARRRAAAVHHDRGQVSEAIELLVQAEDWPAGRSAVVEACAPTRDEVSSPVLERWRRLLPTGGSGPERDLLGGILERRRDPGSERGWELLGRAAAAFEARQDRFGSAAALGQLMQMAWHRQDVDALCDAIDRVDALARTGWEPAGRVALLGRILRANGSRDYEGALAAIEAVDRADVPPEWGAVLDGLASVTLLMLGRAEEALALADRAVATQRERGSAAGAVDALIVRWFSARPLDVLDRLPIDPEETPTAYDRYLAGALAAIAYAWTGRCDEARAALDELAAGVGTLEGTMPRAVETATEAGLAVAVGDEDAARDRLRDFLGERPLADGPVEQALRRFLTLPYVLLPETRAFWDAQAYGPVWVEQRAAARALVAARAGCADEVLTLTPERVVTALPLPWAVELAVALADAGQELGGAVLLWIIEHLGPPARHAVRAATRPEEPGGGTARAVLAAVPIPPAAPLRLAVLGPAELWRGTELVDAPEWRREKVRLLLLYLLLHGPAGREEIATALWPDLDARRAGHNLRVNLTHLHALLEPDRAAGDATWFVRPHGLDLDLHASPYLSVDVWDFHQVLDRADRADREGVPSMALAGAREALALWRGEPLADVRYEEWATTERDRLRARFTRTVVRAGELALAAGQSTEAEDLAHRALDVEPWSEGAYRVLIGAHLARGDRASARRAVERCQAMLDDLGVGPEAVTATTFRRVLSGG